MNTKEILEKFDFEHFRDVPNKPGYVVHDRFCTYYELKTALYAYLSQHTVKHIEAQHHFEYIETGAPWNNFHNQIPQFSKIYCFANPGANEGFYIHIESSYNNTTTSLIVMKLFADIDTVIKLNSLVTRFIFEILEK